MTEIRVVVRNDKEVTVTRRNQTVEGETDVDARLWQTIQVLQGLIDEQRLTKREEFELLGRCLFDLLFTGKVRDTIARWLKDDTGTRGAQDEVPFLRLVFQFDQSSGSLAVLPWEFLHIPSDVNRRWAGFAAARRELAFSRCIYLEGDEVHPPLVNAEPLRVLVGVASPRKVEQHGLTADLVEVAKEASVADELLAAGAEVTSAPDLTLTSLRTALRDGVDDLRPHIVHLVAHGAYDSENEHGTLALCQESRVGMGRWVKDSDIADCFVHIPHLVFLHACEGARTNQIRGLRGIALKLVEKGMPAVVAMNFEIEAQMAHKFAVRVYQELAKGTAIDRAVQLGRADLGTDGQPDGSFTGREFGCPAAFLQTLDAVTIPMRERPTAPLGPVPTPAPVNGALTSATAMLPCRCGNMLLRGMVRCDRCTRFVTPCTQPECGQLRYIDTNLCPWCGHDYEPVGTKAEGLDALGSARLAPIASGGAPRPLLGPDRREQMS